mgnify:CR=1 FL=1
MTYLGGMAEQMSVEEQQEYKEIVATIMYDKEKPHLDEIRFAMLAEFGEENYLICKKILVELTPWVVDKPCVCSLGQRIHDRGGLQSMQMNFYTMLHYMTDNMDLKNKVKDLKFIWHGVGDWKY